jgi:hypothetical protein
MQEPAAGIKGGNRTQDRKIEGADNQESFKTTLK